MLFTKLAIEYFKSPFFWWGIALLIFTNLYANSTINQILQSLLIDQLYLPIFIASLTCVIIIASYPIRQGLRKFYREHDRKTRLVYASLIFLTFLIYTPFFLIDSRMILGVLWQSAIVDQEQFQYAKNLNIFAQFVGLPVVQFYNFHIIKSRLDKEGYKTDDKLRNNLKSVFYAIGVCVIMIIVAGFLTGMFSS